jgi:hypothetical protein
MVEDRLLGAWFLLSIAGLDTACSSDTPIGMGPFRLVVSQAAPFRRPCTFPPSVSTSSDAGTARHKHL